jgi:hypothetical protein
VGILALDVSRFGVVMSADSQPVELLDRRNRVTPTRARMTRNPIIVRRGGGFKGLIGFVGRERIAGRPSQDWLRMFSAHHPDEPLAAFCGNLADHLSRQWRRQRWRSGLWVFISGYEGSEARFWYVCNVEGMYDDGTYRKPGPTFNAVNDLEIKLAPELNEGRTKEQTLRIQMIQFRNGVLVPSAGIFDAFTAIRNGIYAKQIPEFPPIRSLGDLAFYDPQRLEFTKRLHSPKYGIAAEGTSPGIDGAVHVIAVTPSGEIRDYSKQRGKETLVP